MQTTDSDLFLNETLQTIKNRHSVRLYIQQEVPDEYIKILIQSANEAPSAHNQQAWRFIVIKNEKKQELASLITSKSGGFPKPASTLLRMAARSIMSAPVIIAVANTGNLIEHGTSLFRIEKEIAQDFFRTMEIQSSAAAIENLLLAATSLGLATVWLGILLLIKDDILQLLGEPDGEFMAIVPVGYADRQSAGPTKQPFEMKVRYLD